MRRRGKGKKSFGVLLIHCIHIQTCIIYSAEETSESFALNEPAFVVCTPTRTGVLDVCLALSVFLWGEGGSFRCYLIISCHLPF